MAILLLNPSIRLLLRNTTPVIPINNYQSLNRLNYNAPLFPHSNKKSYRAIKTRRQIRTLAIKESRISSPPNFQEPEAQAAVRIRPRTRASTAKERHKTAKGKPQQRAFTAEKRQGITKVKPRTRASTTRKHNSRSPPSPPRSDLGVAIEGEYEIQRIIDHRSTPSGNEYKVVWTDIWVKVDNLGGVKKALQDFQVERYGKTSKSVVRNRVSSLPLVRSTPTREIRSLGTFIQKDSKAILTL